MPEPRVYPAYRPRVYPAQAFQVGDRVRARPEVAWLPRGVGWITLAWWPPFDDPDPVPIWWYAVYWSTGGRGMAREDELVREEIPHV